MKIRMFAGTGASLVFALVLNAQAMTFTSTNSLVGPDSVVTFETGSTGLPNVPGLTFTTYGLALSEFTSALFGNQAYGNGTSYSDLYIQFNPPVTEVGAWGAPLYPTLPHPIQLQVNVYGFGHSLLEGATLPLLSKPTAPDFLGFYEAAGITEIDWIGGHVGYFEIDNVTYGDPESVPEPDFRYCLLLFCLFALGGKLRLDRRLSQRTRGQVSTRHALISNVSQVEC